MKILNHQNPSIHTQTIEHTTQASQQLSGSSEFELPTTAAQYTMGIMLTNIPPDQGNVQYNITSQDNRVKYISPNIPVTVNTYANTLNWPANTPNGTISFTYTPYSGQLQANEQITAFVAYIPPNTTAP